MHSSVTSFTHFSRVPSLSERGILSTPLHLPVNRVERGHDVGRALAHPAPEEFLVLDQFPHGHLGNHGHAGVQRHHPPPEHERHHHTLIARFLEFSIRSGSVPFLRLVCSTSSPLPWRIRVSRPAAMAASRVWVAAVQVLAGTVSVWSL